MPTEPGKTGKAVPAKPLSDRVKRSVIRNLPKKATHHQRQKGKSVASWYAARSAKHLDPLESPPAKGTVAARILVTGEAIDVTYTSFAGQYLASPMEHVKTIRHGVPASMLVETIDAMAMPRERLLSFLQLPRATINRKISAKDVLSPDMSERVLGLRKLIGQVEVMVHESGDSTDFDAAKWVASWLCRPSEALGGQKPGDLMDTVAGQELVSSLLARMQSGAYA